MGRTHVVFLVSLFAGFSAAGGPSDTATIALSPTELPPLDLGVLVKEALEKNADLQSSRYQAVAGEAAIGPAGAYEDPMVSVEAMSFPVDTFSRSEFGMTGIQLSASQKIPFPGKLTKKREAARHEFAAQKEVARQKELDVVRSVKVAYYELFAAYRKYDALKEQRALFEQLLVVARNSYSVGKIPQAEVLGLQVEAASLLDQSLAAEKTIQAKLGELSHAVGRSDHGSYVVGRPSAIVKTRFNFAAYPLAKLLKAAVEKSPLARARGAMVRAAEERSAFAKRNLLPDFEFKLGYTFRRPSMGDRGVDFVSGMVGISIPLWAAAKQSEEKQGAEAERMRSEAMLAEERNRLAHALHEVYASLQETSRRVELYESGVLPLTRQAVVASRSAYLTGKIDYATLLAMVNRRFQTEIAYAEALAMHETRLAELEAIVGENLEG